MKEKKLSGTYIQSTVEFLTFLFKIFRLSILEKADSSASAL